VFGPFLSDYYNNDESIFKNCLHKNEWDTLNWLHKDDFIIVDRGFHDSISTIKRFGYETVMPSFLKRKKNNLLLERLIILVLLPKFDGLLKVA
jgi:hypothetical protein